MITKILNGILNTLWIIIDIPVIPPSNIVFGIKKHSIAKAATIHPNDINPKIKFNLNGDI